MASYPVKRWTKEGVNQIAVFHNDAKKRGETDFEICKQLNDRGIKTANGVLFAECTLVYMRKQFPRAFFGAYGDPQIRKYTRREVTPVPLVPQVAQQSDLTGYVAELLLTDARIPKDRAYKMLDAFLN